MAVLGEALTDDEKGTIAVALMTFAAGGPPEQHGAMLQMLTDIGEKLGITDALFEAEQFLNQMAATAGHGRRRRT